MTLDSRPASAPDPCRELREGIGPCHAEHEDSPLIRDLLARLADKWSLLVIGVLSEGPLRFGDVQQQVAGISHRMLTQTLRHLERDGMVTRTSFPEIPPRVEYEATTLGRRLSVPVLALAQWVSEHRTEILAARAGYDERQERSSSAP